MGKGAKLSQLLIARGPSETANRMSGKTPDLSICSQAQKERTFKLDIDHFSEIGREERGKKRTR